MALTIHKAYTALITQDGNFIYLSDKSVWPISGYNEADIVHCLFVEDLTNPGIYTPEFRDEAKSIYGYSGVEYNIFAYAVPRWTGAAATAGDIVWYDEKVWKCLINTVNAPDYTSEWEEITATNADEMNAISVDLTNNYYYQPSYSAISGNFSTSKTADHAFTVTWQGDGDAVSYRILTYNNVLLDSGTADSNEVSYTFDTDGVYYIEFTIDDGTIHFAEIYDFTDSEICYLNLLKDILCECVDCNDCPDGNYNRAVNFALTYQALRDMVNADLAAQLGTVDTETLRTDYLTDIGILLKKLAILTASCTCSDS